MPAFVPVNEPLLNGNEKLYLNDCIESGWISSEGPYVSKFEIQMGQLTERDHCITVSNGSDALELAISSLHLAPGDEVILPSFTIISCAQAITRSGAVPILVDCDEENWNMNVSDVAERVTDKTKAILAVHTYGLPVDMQPILDIASTFDLKIIEDAAEAIGQEYRGRPCGSFGDVSIFSFYANKHVTMGEGGMVATNDPEIAQFCTSARNLHFGMPRFVHHKLGWNMRISNLQAAVGVAQIERLKDTLVRKKKMGQLYTKLLNNVSGIQLPLSTMEYAENNYWVYGIVLDDNIPFEAAEAMKRLAEMGVGTRPFFWPIHQQPVFQEMGLFKGESYPVSERLARRGFYIPSGTALSEEEIEFVASQVGSALN